MDLTRQEAADERIVRRLTTTLPNYALDRADRWRATATSEVADLFQLIWRAADRQRANLMTNLRDTAEAYGEYEVEGGW
jgi:hypothetical protein